MNKKKMIAGLVLMVTFFIVLILFFSPLYGGKNGLQYLDDLYNSISKGSAYYIPGVQKEVDQFAGKAVNVQLDLKKDDIANQTALLFMKAGAAVQVSGPAVTVSGDLKTILSGTLADADLMYHNKGREIAGKYGYDERQAVYNWWNALKLLDAGLKKQEAFKEAKVVTLTMNKAVETAYNYYTIEPQSIGDKWGIVAFSLVFYVLYTLWYGFGVMFMFEGAGMKLEH